MFEDEVYGCTDNVGGGSRKTERRPGLLRSPLMWKTMVTRSESKIAVGDVRNSDESDKLATMGLQKLYGCSVLQLCRLS